MWHEKDSLVEQVITQFTSRSVGLPSDVSLKPHANRGSKRQNICFIVGAVPSPTEAVYKHPSIVNTEQGLCQWDSTIKSTKPVVYLLIFEKKTRSH